jgi:hypothetical protein
VSMANLMVKPWPAINKELLRISMWNTVIIHKCLESVEANHPVSFRKEGKVIPADNSLSTQPWRCMGEWRYSYTILSLDAKSRRVVSFTPPCHFTSVPIVQEAGWTLELVSMLWNRKKKSLAPTRNWTPITWHNTQLSQLLVSKCQLAKA